MPAAAYKIDAVIAWVDGSDPEHRAKHLRHLKPGAKEKTTRFADRGEVYYCIASILKFAPFINRVWIVTDMQRPKFIDAFAKAGLCAADFIRVVDHTELFGEHVDALPTFSARAIEAMVWRIPGLSEHYVYFNDDFFINQPLKPESWFVDGRPVLHGRKVRPDHRLIRTRLRRLLSKLNLIDPRSLGTPTYHRAQELGATHAGVTQHFMLADHHPHPMRRSVQAAFYEANPEVLRKQISHRFRDIGQFSPVALANHLEIAEHGATYSPPPAMIHVKPDSRKLNARLAADIGSETKSFGCIQSLDRFDAETLALVRRLMREKWGGFLPGAIKFADDVPLETG